MRNIDLRSDFRRRNRFKDQLSRRKCPYITKTCRYAKILANIDKLSLCYQTFASVPILNCSFKVIETATENGVGQAGSCGSYSSIASLIAPGCLFCTPLAIFPTRCYQLDSNLANLKTIVGMG